jgi:hypothetical protein
MRTIIRATVVLFFAIPLSGQDSCAPFNINDVGGTSPIVINFANGGYRLTGENAPVRFDIKATGQPLWIGWTAAGTEEAFLALDRNHNGAIDNGAELFGNATPLLDGSRARNGFIALAQYDDNHDGVIDASDPIWRQLVLWCDLNHDGLSQSAEIVAVGESALRAISLDSHWSGRRDESGNEFRYQSTVTMDARGHKATPRPVYDIFFAVWPAGPQP